ncbi:MAG TPA: DUF1501 domain-containing protein [Planctomycetota bacterium]|nr:DUF1501 domain-containing protein [Planctomycetota bacterium]
MFRIDSGAPYRKCDGISRRNFIELGMAGMASVGLPTLLQAREAWARAGRTPKDTRVILLWLDGGPPHTDLYDMKPDAPADHRGFWRPIPTNVPGIRVNEMLPRQARVADRFSIVRSLCHGSSDHAAGSHVMMTGRWGATGENTRGTAPSIGSIASKVLGSRESGLPPYVSIPIAKTFVESPGYFAANYLGHPYDPFETGGDPASASFEVQNLRLTKGLTLSRLDDRRTLKKAFDSLKREADANGQFDAMDQFEKQAFDLVTSPQVRRAFDLSSEDPKLRDRYGRHTWGQSTLLARRLVEAGVTFATVQMGDWDFHSRLKEGMQNFVPKLDSAVATLFEDLSSRGLLEKVLVVVCGEFGRTPRMNDGKGEPPGRDHWGNAMFALLGGGGIKGGTVVGATDSRGEAPTDRPLSPQDLHATLYRVLGIDPGVQFPNHSGRPVSALEGGEPIRELF